MNRRTEFRRTSLPHGALKMILQFSRDRDKPIQFFGESIVDEFVPLQRREDVGIAECPLDKGRKIGRVDLCVGLITGARGVETCHLDKFGGGMAVPSCGCPDLLPLGIGESDAPGLARFVSNFGCRAARFGIGWNLY